MLLNFKSGADIKFPFCVYGLGRFKFRYLECVWCGGAGKNLVRSFPLFSLPRSEHFLPGSLDELHDAECR